MFTCPHCRRRFHRAFLEQHWSEWCQVCWSSDAGGFRQDCELFRAPHKITTSPGSASGGEHVPSEDGPAPGPTVMGACVGECPSCGDHNRLAIVTSDRVLSRCLRCGDEAMLDSPPAWCHAAGLRQVLPGGGDSTGLPLGARSEHEPDDEPLSGRAVIP